MADSTNANNEKVSPEQVLRRAWINEIQEILLEQIELAKPDSLAFLESQVPYIVGRITRLPYSQRGFPE